MGRLLRVISDRSVHVLWVLAMLAWHVPVGSAETTQDAGRATTQVGAVPWTESLASLGHGRLAKTTEIIHRIISGNTDAGRLERVDGWLVAFEKLQEARQGRIQQDYERYVQWVREDLEGTRKGDGRENEWWALAIADADRAFNTTTDKEAFRAEPWLNEVVQGGLKAADAFEKEGKWFPSAGIHARLEDMFPQDKGYRKALQRCQVHIRLELTYAPDSDWEAEVRDIVPEMGKEAFHRVEEEYLRKPDFKEMAISAMEQLLLLADNAEMAKVFDKMNDKYSLEAFKARVRARLRQAEKAEKLSADDLVEDCFEPVLVINTDTSLLPESVLVYEFMQGAFQPLDTFTDMIWPASIAEFHKHTQGKFSGVGIQIRKLPGDPILVVSPLRGSPAYKEGIRPGDLITKINDEPADKFTIQGAVREITGPVGTTVRLTVQRTEKDGTERVFEVKLERQEIKISTIRGYERDHGDQWKYMIDAELKIGYARMTNFTDETIEELQDVIEQLRDKEGMRGLVFDLRENPGGPLKAAIDVTDLFLGGNKQIVSTKDRDGKPWSETSTNEARFDDFPMIVLVDSSSASASEIVAGALQVHRRALIVGERSFGKGSVQQVLPLNHSRLAFLKLTTARYYLPNGRCLHREEDSASWGVDPDVGVVLVPKENVNVRKLQLRTEILRGKDQEDLTEEALRNVTEYGASQPSSEEEEEEEDGEEAVEEEAKHDEAEEAEEIKPLVERTDPNEFPEIDPQLDMAILLMRVRLESGQPWPEPAEAMAATPTDVTGG